MIRIFEPQDMDAVLEILVRGSLQAHGFIEESYWERQKERLRENLLSHAITAVYCDPTTERIGGFISLVENFIVALYVAREEQGRGIGHNLLQRAKYLYPVLELSVYTENRAALSFYLLVLPSRRIPNRSPQDRSGDGTRRDADDPSSCQITFYFAIPVHN